MTGVSRLGFEKKPMKISIVVVLAALAVVFASACSSGARVGTRHHHVSVGGSAG